jgi:hypothetical protein
VNLDELKVWELKLIYSMVKSKMKKKRYAELRQAEDVKMKRYIKRNINKITLD